MPGSSLLTKTPILINTKSYPVPPAHKTAAKIVILIYPTYFRIQNAIASTMHIHHVSWAYMEHGKGSKQPRRPTRARDDLSRHFRNRARIAVPCGKEEIWIRQGEKFIAFR